MSPCTGPTELDGRDEQTVVWTVSSDLFLGHRLTLEHYRGGRLVETVEKAFETLGDVDRFVALRLDQGLFGAAAAGREPRRNRSGVEQNLDPQLANLDSLLRCLQSCDAAILSDKAQKGIGELKTLVAKFERPASRRDGQLDLFEDDFEAVGRFAGLSLEILKALAQTLFPQCAIGERNFLIPDAMPWRAARNVVRLAGVQREALKWSVFTAFDDRPATRASLRRLTQRGIHTLLDLTRLTQREAFLTARPDIPTWLRMKNRLSSLGLNFRIEAEELPRARARA